MKTLRHLSLLIIFCCVFTNSKAQWVTIPDTAFASILRTKYPTCMNGNQMDTTCTAVITATQFGFSNNLFVKNLDGVQYFDQLTDLAIYDNAITSLPSLPPSLTYLGCQRNALTVLPTLPPNLDELSCFNNQITSLPSIPNTVRRLFCHNNQLTSLPTLPTSLQWLICNDNQITTIPALGSSVVRIDCYNNQLTSLPSLPPSFQLLYCQRNMLTSLPSLPFGFKHLDCSGNQLTSLPQLPSGLLTLYCYNNLLSVMPALPATCTAFKCQNNFLTSLPTLPDSLNEFNCSYNRNLLCMPKLGRINTMYFDSTGITCLPNYGRVTFSRPALNTLPLCSPGNTSGCEVLWNITGKVYSDINGNCVQQPGDSNISNIKLSLLQNGVVEQQTYTTSFGAYAFDTDTGAYTVTIDTTGVPFDIKCPASRFDSVSVTFLDSLKTGNNFAMQCKPGFDVAVISMVTTAPAFRPAVPNLVAIKAGDVSMLWGNRCNTNNISGQLTVTFTGPAHYVGAANGALVPVVNGQTLTYTVANWASILPGAFNFFIAADTNAQPGPRICFDVVATSATADNNPANNRLNYCASIVNSYDPNDKQVSPADNIDNTSQWLTYTIRFQNTGSAPAINVYVIDTLDAALDFSTFQLLAYSHQPEVQIYNAQGRVKFNFPDINLADSVNNEPESHGYIQYRIKTLPGLNCGTQIGNAAYIYFDFNPPVATNAALNTIYMSSTTNLQNSVCNGEQFNFNGRALTAAGNYTDTLQAAFACDSIINLQLDVLQAVEVTVDTAILSGTSLVLPSGATVTAPGNYTDTLQSLFGCDSIITTRLSVISGIENLANTGTMQVYPNPAQNVVMINLSENLTGGSLTLTDVTGRILNTMPVTALHNELNTAALSSGVYLLTAVKGGDRVVQRLVVSK